MVIWMKYWQEKFSSNWLTAIFETGYASHNQRFIVRHGPKDYSHDLNLLRFQLDCEFLHETGMLHRAHIFQNWMCDGHVKQTKSYVFKLALFITLRKCNLEAKHIRCGQLGIPYHVRGDVDTQDLEWSNSFDSHSIDDKLRWGSLLHWTKEDLFLAV